ncbi:hypothetical protein XM47_13770 [Catenovulum maritimum]|uniref:Alpha-galactosidase n=1 Tax=Catenovulum maritimum TaxID=1513271 RepID=A0A0J8GP33_9ALTE|nr:hypothetical protein XM47_13770 [Catenovulum maritimum]
MYDQSSNEPHSDNFHDWAKRPPLGWNSYNCFGAAVKEAEIRANADYMAKHLKKYGWEYIVVDYCWYYPHPPGSIQSNPPQFRLKKDDAPVPWFGMDEYGRLLPAIEKFPSAARGNGFKELADYIHSLGLKFGIHVMRGVPRQAVWAKTPIKGAPGIDASMIADTREEMQCGWLNSMYAIDMSKPGAQEYYDSIVELYNEWNVDYIKMDDLDSGNPKRPYRKTEAEAMRNAIDNNGKPIVLSLSLFLKHKDREHLKQTANLWRISSDFWDDWGKLKKQFDWCFQWQDEVGTGYGPDADMLALGSLAKRGPVGIPRISNFNEAEQYTHMTLWSIFRSPLMMGGHMPENSEFVKSLLSNNEILYVNQFGQKPKQFSRQNEQIIWVAEDSQSSAKFVAVFNLADNEQAISFSPAQFAFGKGANIRDLWQKRNLGKFDSLFTTNVAPHGAQIFKLFA